MEMFYIGVSQTLRPALKTNICQKMGCRVFDTGRSVKNVHELLRRDYLNEFELADIFGVTSEFVRFRVNIRKNMI